MQSRKQKDAGHRSRPALRPMPHLERNALQLVHTLRGRLGVLTKPQLALALSAAYDVLVLPQKGRTARIRAGIVHFYYQKNCPKAPAKARAATAAAKARALSVVLDYLDLDLALDTAEDVGTKADGAFEILNGAPVRRQTAEEGWAALQPALERGKSRAQEILKQSDMLTLKAFAEFLDVSQETVNARRNKGLVLAVKGEARGFRYPRWQVGDYRQILGGLKEVIAFTGNGWPAYFALQRRYDDLDGTGLEALRRGDTEELMRVLRGYGEGFA